MRANRKRTIGLSRLVAALSALAVFAASAARPEEVGAERRLVHDGRSRSYILDTPLDGFGKTPAALVVVLHGLTGSGKEIRHESRFDQLARREGFFAVFPDGLRDAAQSTGSAELDGGSWNAGACCGFALKEKADDVGFVVAVIERLAAEFSIDPGAIYVTGFSNGGMMAYRLACEASATFAAAAPVSALHLAGSCVPERPISILHLHGARDGLIPVMGGAGEEATLTRPRPPVRAGIEFWVAVNGCSVSPLAQVLGEDWSFTFGGCREGVAVELHLIDNRGHEWLSWLGAKSGAFGERPKVWGTEFIWRFLSAHRRSR